MLDSVKLLDNPKISKIIRIISVPTILVLILAASRYSVYVGIQNAKRDIKLKTTILPYVLFEAKEQKDSQSCNLSEENFRLLSRSEGIVAVITPIDDQIESPKANARVCVFYEENIKSMRIQVPIMGEAKE